MRFVAVAGMVLLLCCTAEARVLITEIMYNPDGNEQDFEFVELFGNESVAGWHFEGIDFVFPNLSIEGYVVIAADVNQSAQRYGTNISFDFRGSLKNTGETLILRNAKGEIVDAVTYDDWAEENHSIERVTLKGYSSDPDNWVQSAAGGTAGRAFSEDDSEKNVSCSWELFIDINETISEEPEWKIKVVHEGAKANITIVQEVRDAFGEVVEDYIIEFENVTRQRTSRSYSPSLKTGAYLIRAEANDTCSGALTASQLIYVREKATKTPNKSESSITAEVNEKDYSFGGVVLAELHVYRGDTRSYAVTAVIKDGKKKVSEKVTTHIKTAFVNQTIVVPVLLQECGDEGTYDLVVEGFGITEVKKIDVGKNKKCREVKELTLVSRKESKTTANKTEEVNKTVEKSERTKHIDFEDLHQKRGTIIYESSSVQMKKMVPWFICLALGLLATGLVLQKT